MEASERDSTGDWLLPEHSRPPLVGELEARIDEAIAIARSSEAAVMTVGAAAIEAAEQARHAAELAERASASMAAAQPGPAEPARSRVGPPDGAEAPVARDAAPPDEDDGLRDFTARADRIAARLRDLEEASAPAPG